MSERAGGMAFWGALAVVLVLLAILLAGGTNEEPFDPRSVATDGAKGLVDLIGAFGADVRLGVSQPTPGDDVALLLRDTYGLDGRGEVESWVRSGGILVIADSSSPLSPRTDGAGGPDADPGCPVPALAGVQEIVGTSTAFAAPPDGELCFGGALALDPLGDGVVVSLAGPRPFLNEDLNEADNAALAVSLLAPLEGTSVAFLEPRLFAGSAGESLVDLVPDPAWVLLVQLAVGFLLYAWWRARRLGRPVLEPALVQIEGSELAAARGRLLEGIRQPASAAVDLRANTRRQLLRRFGLPPETTTDVLASRVGLLTSLSAAEATEILDSRPINSDAGLRRLSAELVGVRASVFDPLPVQGDAE